MAGTRKSKNLLSLKSTLQQMVQRPTMTQAQIDKTLAYLQLDPEDQKKDVFNTLSRLQHLMRLDTNYIDKNELLSPRQYNQDLPAS